MDGSVVAYEAFRGQTDIGDVGADVQCGRGGFQTKDPSTPRTGGTGFASQYLV